MSEGGMDGPPQVAPSERKIISMNTGSVPQKEWSERWKQAFGKKEIPQKPEGKPEGQGVHIAENKLSQEKTIKGKYGLSISKQLNKELKINIRSAGSGDEKAVLISLLERYGSGSDPENIENDFDLIINPEITNNFEQLLRKLLTNKVEENKINELLGNKLEGSFYMKMEQMVVSQVMLRKYFISGFTENEISAAVIKQGKNIVDSIIKKGKKLQKEEGHKRRGRRKLRMTSVTPRMQTEFTTTEYPHGIRQETDLGIATLIVPDGEPVSRVDKNSGVPEEPLSPENSGEETSISSEDEQDQKSSVEDDVLFADEIGKVEEEFGIEWSKIPLDLRRVAIEHFRNEGTYKEQARKSSEELLRKRADIAREWANNRDQMLKERRNKSTDAYERAIYDGLITRYGVGSDSKNTESDFKNLTENPEQLIRELLINGVPEAEINTILIDKSKKSFYKKMMPEIASEIISRKILTGGLTKEDVSIIEKTQWLKEVFEKSIEESEKTSEILVKLGESIGREEKPRLGDDLSLKNIIEATMPAAVKHAEKESKVVERRSFRERLRGKWPEIWAWAKKHPMAAVIIVGLLTNMMPIAPVGVGLFALKLRSKE